MENIYAVDNNKNTEFKTRLKVGEVVIVEYSDIKLKFERSYVSVVKDITIDKENNIYTCRLNNFNVDFKLYNQKPLSISSGGYMDFQEHIYSDIYKIEDFERYINRIRYYIDENNLYSLSNIIKNYQILVEAMKLKEKLNNQ